MIGGDLRGKIIWRHKKDIPKIPHYAQRRRLPLKEYKEEIEETLRKHYPEIFKSSKAR